MGTISSTTADKRVGGDRGASNPPGEKRVAVTTRAAQLRAVQLVSAADSFSLFFGCSRCYVVIRTVRTASFSFLGDVLSQSLFSFPGLPSGDLPPASPSGNVRERRAFGGFREALASAFIAFSCA